MGYLMGFYCKEVRLAPT